MTDTDKINATLNAMKDVAGEVGGLGTSDAKKLIASLRIAVHGLESIGKQSGGRRVDPLLCAIVKVLEGAGNE
jgi:hypothetical protein